MKVLTQIVKKLKPVEVRILRNLYRLKHNGEPKRRLQLFNLALKRPAITDEQAAKKIYKREPDSGFSHLKERLKKDILNVIIFADPNKQYTDVVVQQRLLCQKHFLQGRILLGRGVREEAYKILQQGLDIATDYEFPGLEVDIRDLLRRTRGYRFGFNDFNKHTERIEVCWRMKQYILKAIEFYWTICLPNQFATNRSQEYIDEGLAALEQMEGFLAEIDSIRVKFWYYRIGIYVYSSLLKDFKLALDFQLKLLDLVSNHTMVYSRANFAGINKSLASTYFFLGQYDKAIHHTTAALELFSPKDMNHLNTLEFLFWSHLRNNNKKEAGEILYQALTHECIDATVFHKSKWMYLKANLAFLQHDYDAAMEALVDTHGITKDKSGWMLGYKLLQIYVGFENEEYYWLEFQLENFRKLIERQTRGNMERAKTIHKIARSLLNLGGDFKTLQIKEQKRLNLLEEGKDEYYWDPMGFEVIRFDSWVHKKILK